MRREESRRGWERVGLKCSDRLGTFNRIRADRDLRDRWSNHVIDLAGAVLLFSFPSL